ncbi:MAG: hypothetical protein OEZ39_14750 [Gammaproteobacteria bacterium]|nr:hypothetical protein [Gammaproteobacteria bacterium]MDH5653113.1 hypothetical protein [Gammaproteobacteria bacterium]
MINWLKYMPIKLRELNQDQPHPTPRGPSFAGAGTMRFLVGGSELSFRSPRHRPTRSTRKSYKAKSYQDLLKNRFSEFSRGAMPDDSWLYQSVFNRSFAFYGPWFSGPQYQLHLYVNLLTQRHSKEGVSFFHPRAFENTLADLLTSEYAHKTSKKINRWSAPVNWRPLNTLPVPAVVFDIEPTIWELESNKTQVLCFPVSDKHLLQASFTQVLFANTEEREKYYDIGPMESMENDIINSFNLKLTPEIQTQINRVKTECPNMSLVENYPPLKWRAGKIESSQENSNLLLD